MSEQSDRVDLNTALIRQQIADTELETARIRQQAAEAARLAEQEYWATMKAAAASLVLREYVR